MIAEDPFFSRERLNEVLHRYEQSLQENNNPYFDVDELEALVEHFIRKKKFKNAQDILQKGMNLHPGNTALQVEQVNLFLETKKLEKALSLAEQLLLVDPDNPDVFLLKGEILLSSGKEEEAKRYFMQLVGEQKEETGDLCSDIAYVYLARLDFETAAFFLNKGSDIQTGNLEIRFELASCYEQFGQTQAAVDVYNQILDIDSYASEAWFNLAQLFFFEEEYGKAAEAYDFAYITGKKSDALLQKAHSLFQDEKYEKAFEAYVEYAETFGYTAAAYVFTGECFEKMERYTEAKARYRKAIETDPLCADAWTGLAICCLEEEHFKECLIYINEAIRIDESVGENWIYKAEAYINLDNNDEALFCYLKALEINPGLPEACITVGNIKFEAGCYEEALHYYEKALSLDSQSEELLLSLAIAYYKTDKKERSFVCLSDAVSKNKEIRDLFFELCPEAKSDPFFPDV